MASRGARAWVGNVVLLVASAAFALAAGEAAVRLLGLAPRYGPMVWVSSTTGDVKPGTLALLAYPTNPGGYFPLDLRDAETRARYEAAGVKHLGDVVATSPHAIEYRFNALAFRGADVPPRRPGTARVAMVGDSFTLGWGVKEEDATPVLLDGLLGGFAAAPAEVVNCGRAGADFPLLTTVFENALRTEPDVVVYAMVLNDPDRSERMVERLRSGVLRGANNLFVPGRAPTPPRAPFGSRLLALVGDRLETRKTRDEMVRWHLDLFGEENHRGWARTRDGIKAMDERLRARGGRFLLVLWPLLADLDGDYPFAPAHAEVAAFAQRSGIAFHDLLPAFRGRRTPELWAHPVDRHPNAAAQRIAAESVKSAIGPLLARR